MRADRLLAILLLLQRGTRRGGRVTAGDLAKRLEVSVRTIYRDLEALGAAGVPVYAETGRNGGIRLLAAYSTDLTGLSLGEAELVPLLGLSDAFAGIALGTSLRRTETKLLMALPDDQRSRAEQARRRIHVDLARWWDHAEPVPHLAAIAEAVLGTRRVRLGYRRGDDAPVVERTLDPLGLVVQGGTWYLVGRPGTEEIRIYRVSRVVDADVTDETFEFPDDFDLPAFWSGRKEEFHMTRPGYHVTVRARQRVLRSLTHGQGLESGAAQHSDEWITTELSFGTRAIAFERLLGFGANVVVVEPEELRDAIASSVREMQALYS